jgi:hypothetical protein
MQRKIACFCENTFDAQIPEEADLAVEPDVEGLILSGDFMAVACPACGKRLTPEYPFRLSSVSGIGEIFLVPEADRVIFARGRLPYAVGSPTRVVVGFGELTEKVLIGRSGLDDRVVEIMKFYLLTGSSEGLDGERGLSLSYKGEKEGRFVFHIAGVKEKEIAVARLSREFYLRIHSEIEKRVAEEPFRDFCAPPWVSLRRAYAGTE